MKKLWIPLLALCALFAFGCKSDAGNKAADNAATTTNATDSAKPKDGDAATPGADSNEFVGKWAQKDGGSLDLVADGTFSMGDGKGTTMIGTYKIGDASKTLTGGKEFKMTLTDAKADDPSKQADVDKHKADVIKFANTQPAASIKMDADGTMEWQDPGSTKIDKLTKKA